MIAILAASATAAVLRAGRRKVGEESAGNGSTVSRLPVEELHRRIDEARARLRDHLNRPADE